MESWTGSGSLSEQAFVLVISKPVGLKPQTSGLNGSQRDFTGVATAFTQAVSRGGHLAALVVHR
jgi:hypothetical protein